MRGLTSTEVLSIWERGQTQSPVRRAILFLSTSCEDETTDSIASLPLGERDQRLLELRERTFGNQMSGLAHCPQCGEEMQADFQTGHVRVGKKIGEPTFEINHTGLNARIRLPDSRDMEALRHEPDELSARRTLLARCVTRVNAADGKSCAVESLPEDFIAMIAAKISAADPQADVELSLTCPACRHEWTEPFDVAQFFWTELQSYARRLLREVHELATAYGWSEPEILALTPARRAAYLELVRG